MDLDLEILCISARFGMRLWPKIYAYVFVIASIAFCFCLVDMKPLMCLVWVITHSETETAEIVVCSNHKTDHGFNFVK